MSHSSPEIVFAELFIDLHLSGIIDDGKVITDAIPQDEPSAILAKYRRDRDLPDFDLKNFYHQHFKTGVSKAKDFKSDTSQPVEVHIERLWDILKRDADEAIAGSSLIPLPHPYVVPGGRFNEIYYWDSYFTMLGLQVSGRIDLIESMIDNFSYLIETIGFIPNGNRSYFLGRSQPPFYALMIQLLAEEQGQKVLSKYLPYLRKEYEFWMFGQAQLSPQNEAIEHVVLLGDQQVLNRYYDRHQQPRAEMYGADMETFGETNRDFKEFFLDIRAACESGWDFSSRWLAENMELASIHTAQILPVDLNCLLMYLEMTIAEAYLVEGNIAKGKEYRDIADRRKLLIQEYFWNPDIGLFGDYHFQKAAQTKHKTLAGMFPLFFQIATPEQAKRCALTIENEFLKPGGLLTTTLESGQQWDAPNGWAPLQWIAIKGLRNYGFHDLANEITDNWVSLNKNVFQQTGKLLEKYNVVDTSLLSGGGEYPVQDGFGWTNGVLLKLISEQKEYKLL